MKKRRYFSCKERGHSPYNYPENKKVAVILEKFSKNSNNKKQEQLLPNSRKKACLFFHDSYQKIYFVKVFVLLSVYYRIKLT